MNRGVVREPAVAGQFYPSNPTRLQRDVAQFVEESGVASAPERVAALIVPHAGYVYSGATAGCAYARVRGMRPKRVVLLGCSHRYGIRTASVYTEGAFDTPMGTFPIDEACAQAIGMRCKTESVEPHTLEHSLEVQLPFLAASLGLVPIVPILFGSPASAWHAEVGQNLSELLEIGDLVLASTDLSHYLTEVEANRIDERSIDTVLAGDWEAYAQAVAREECSMCGAAAVTAAMAYGNARGARDRQLLDYRTSAAASGDTSRVVGYAAISMEHAA
jgi:hypothetical protein